MLKIDPNDRLFVFVQSIEWKASWKGGTVSKIFKLRPLFFGRRTLSTFELPTIIHSSFNGRLTAHWNFLIFSPISPPRTNIYTCTKVLSRKLLSARADGMVHLINSLSPDNGRGQEVFFDSALWVDD